MKIVTGARQDRYWQRVGYRDCDHPVALAYAIPKLEHVRKFTDLRCARALDVGCGTGVFTRLLSDLSPFVVGLDYSVHMLERNPGKALMRGRGEELPFAASSFDLVLVGNLLHHAPDPQAIVREAARVSRRYVVAIEPNVLNPVMFLFSLIVPAERGGLRSSRRYLVRLLRESALEVIQCSGMGMISQNNTPAFLVPLLRVFDRELFWGEYLVAIARKPTA